VIDQSAVGTSTRSNPATYTGVMDDVRKTFATANKVDAGLFSFNSKGACENCNGSGVIYTDLAFWMASKRLARSVRAGASKMRCSRTGWTANPSATCWR